MNEVGKCNITHDDPATTSVAQKIFSFDIDCALLDPVVNWISVDIVDD